jgi:tol-pal system protein YbgF
MLKPGKECDAGFSRMSVLRWNLQRAALAACLIVAAGSASAQQPSGGLLDNLFKRGEPAQSQGRGQDQGQDLSQGDDAPVSAADLQVRIDRLESQLRQMTGTIEQLQYRNQQLEQENARLQGGAVQASSGPAAAPAMSAISPRVAAPVAPALPPANATLTARRSDVFDPSQHPDAPGVPRALGGTAPVVPPASAPIQDDVAVGAPGGRAAGAPLDLSSLTTAPATDAPPPSAPQGASLASPGNGALPPPPSRNPSATGAQLATLPPTGSPKDAYELAYGYVLHKDYALAESALQDFLRKNPKDKLVPEAHYWLGESFYQRQRYQDAADSYLVVVRNYDRSEKAPDAMLRLGQSLAALGQKEMACASLGEVNRKYPRAAARLKSTVAAEQKRVHC